MKRTLLLPVFTLSSFFLSGMVIPNPHPDPDRPRIYTYNYTWKTQPELAEKLMRNNKLKEPPAVEKLTGCMNSLKYLITPAMEEIEIKLNLTCFADIQSDELVVIAKGNLNITALPPSSSEKYNSSSIEKRILPGTKPFTVRVSGQIQTPHFAFFNCSSQELLAFPIQKKVTSLHLSFHPDNAGFDWRLLERFPNVTHLEIDGANLFLQDKGFKGKLKNLTLRGCRNIDFPSLNLSALNLDCTEFRPEQLDFLNLSKLEISGSDLSDISFVTRFTNCYYLTLNDCPNLSEIAPLAELKRLRILKLGYTAVRDVTPLAQLEHLANLSLQNNLIGDLSALENRHFRIFSFSGTNPAADCFLGEKFPVRKFTLFSITHPQKIEREGHQWQLQIGGDRIGNMFLPSFGLLFWDKGAFLSRFRLDPRSGQYDGYPYPGKSRFIHIPKEEGKQYSIIIKPGQRFSDFIQVNQDGFTINCAEGKLSGCFKPAQ